MGSLDPERLGWDDQNGQGTIGHRVHLVVALVAPAPADRIFWVGGTGGTKYLVLPGECSGDTEFHPSAGLDQNYPRNKKELDKHLIGRLALSR